MRQRFPLPKIKQIKQEQKQDGDNFDKYLLCPLQLSYKKMNEPVHVESPFDSKVYDKRSIVKYWKDQKCKIPNYEPNDDDFDNDVCDRNAYAPIFTATKTV